MEAHNLESSNLSLFSNVCLWKGRWREGDREFVSKIWDDKALGILKSAARKKELVLSPYQEKLYECTIQCPELPKGERPWGWIAAGKVGCRCRLESCPRFLSCREGRPMTEDEREIWAGGNQEGLRGFEKTWRQNRECKGEERKTGGVDLIKVFGQGEYEPIARRVDASSDPNVASGYPDDEEYE